MKCNSCWRVLEGRAIATTCGHVFCAEDASKILSSDSTCPLCEQILSKSNMRAVDLSPNDDWINMVMAGIAPHNIMKSAFKGVLFWISQKDVENQVTVTKAMQMKQKYEEMQSKYMEKLEEVHSAYQKAMKKIQVLEHEKESLEKDKLELQEKYSEKSRQKRRLEEMYDSMRVEYEQLKRGAIAPLHRERIPQHKPSQYSFSKMQDPFVENISKSNKNLFDIPGVQSSKSGLSSRNQVAGSEFMDGLGSRGTGLGGDGGHGGGSTAFARTDTNSMFTPTVGNPSKALRNLLLSPIHRSHSQARSKGGFSQ